MLHAKFQDHRTSGSGGLLKMFTIYGRGGHLGHVTWTIYTNICVPFPRRFHINLALIGQLVPEEKMFENGERQRQQRRRSMGIL